MRVSHHPPLPAAAALPVDAAVADGGGAVSAAHRPRQHTATPDAGGRLTPAQVQQLLDLGAAYPQNQWPLTADISIGRNKHRTNTFEELRDGLAGPFDWFESDVRMQDGRPVAAHDEGNRDGMTMAEWVQVGAASGRGLKMDFKEARAIAPVVGLIHAAGVPDERLLWNVTIGAGSSPANTSMAIMQELRREFPRSVINLSLSHTPYDDRTITQALDVARQVGGPIMFPLDARFVTPAVVQKFRLGGRVAIWNSPVTYNPTNIPADIAKFRAWGVDGMIDLRSTHFSAGYGDSVDRVTARVPGHAAHAGAKLLAPTH
jgi:hypothetical protein